MRTARTAHESEAIVDAREYGVKNESVTPYSNQRIAPALIPAITTPAFQAARRTLSSPCKRHTASMFKVLPPPT